MRWEPLRSVVGLFLVSLIITQGCAAPRQGADDPNDSPRLAEDRPAGHSRIRLAAHDDPALVEEQPEVAQPIERLQAADLTFTGRGETLSELEALAEAQNPTLHRLQQETAAARAKANYVDKLPDPTVGTNVFGHPIETAAGSQRANLTVMQMIPWLKRLDAQSQQACIEALAAEQEYEVERLRVIGDVRTLWYQLYVVGKQIETNRANQKLLTSLIEVANSRVATGKASQGDVLLGTLELSRLQEQILTLQQQLATAGAEMNRRLGRNADISFTVPTELNVSLPGWSHAELSQTARERQPAIAAAQLRTQATQWGVEVARLKRRPDVSVSASWFAIDDNRPASTMVDVGRDAWSIGAQVSLPLWGTKYDWMEEEATRKHFASHASVEDEVRRFDSLLRDLWEQARAADETAKLYKSTILPQSRQTLNTDLQSYTNGTVEFDRVVRDSQNVLTLELGYHRALGQLAITLARIQQAAGTDLLVSAPTGIVPPQPDLP